MICWQTEGGWKVITQRNHALLSAEMLADWKPQHRPQPWSQLLNACAQHDHGWMEEHHDPLLDSEGFPLDFLSLPLPVTLEIAERNLRNAEAGSRWCAVLVARHIEYLAHAKQEEPLAQAALNSVRARRQEWMGQLRLDDSKVEELYELLCWADTFSLLVCCPPSDFTRSLSLKAQGTEYNAERGAEGEWLLAPWPYRKESVELRYEVRTLQQQRFPDLEAFRSQLRGAEVAEQWVTVRPGRQ